MRGLGIVFRTLSLYTCLALLPCGLQSQTTAERSSKSLHPTGSTGFSLENLPLQFEENQGQATPGAYFLARGRGYTLLLNPDGLVLNLRSDGNRDGSKNVSMHLLGAQVAHPVGREQSVTRTNYYIGKSPSDWHLNVPSYRSVVYPELYKGIDLVYHGNGNQLEYDFLVSPGADPHQVRMQFDGMTPRLQDDHLAFEGESRISVRALKAFQWINGEKKPVDASWEVHGDQASVRLGDYDRGRQLIIDPIFFYGAYIGGSSNDTAVSVVQGQNSTFYVALSTSSPYIQVPTLPSSGCNPQSPTGVTGTCNPNPNPNGTDTLIIKLDASNSPTSLSTSEPFTSVDTASLYPTLVSATYIGDTSGGDTAPRSMVADSNLNLYITGTTTAAAASFPQLGTPLCTQGCPGYVAKLDSSLTATYSLLLPGFGDGIAVDTNGNAYISGGATAGSLTIPPSDVAFQSTVTAGTALTAGANAFLMELGPTFSLLFASYIGGSGTDQGNGIAVSGSTVYVTGQTASPDFPTSSGAYQPAYGGAGTGGQGDAFVVAVNNPATAPALVFSTFLGGASDDYATSIASDVTGNLVVVGSSASSGSGSGSFPIAANPVFEFTRLVAPATTVSSAPIPVTVPLPTTIPAGSQSAFVTGLSADGSTLLFTDFLGGAATPSVSSAAAVTTDQAGVIYVTGGSTATVTGSSTSSSTDFMNGNATTDNWQGFEGNSENNVFFAQIDPAGSHLLQATITGGLGNDAGAGISISGPQAALGVASIVGTAGNPDLFDAAASSVLYPINPPVPAGKDDGVTTGFFVQENLAGYCNMQLTSQVGAQLTFQGNCSSGTTAGTVYVSDTSGSQLQNTPITINAGVGTVSVTLTGGKTGTNYVLNFTFSPLGALGGVGTCQISSGILSGCSIVTNGGGGGTLFNVTAGTLTVALTCVQDASCVPVGGNTPNTYDVFPGLVVTLNATVTNSVPNTVTWGAVNTPQGTLVPPSAPSTSATFAPGLTGGATVITATSAADGSTKGTLTLLTLESPSMTLTVNNSGILSYGQTLTVNFRASGLSSTPSGPFTYRVDGGNSLNGTLSASGVATITLPRLGAGSHDLTVTYPGNTQSGGFLVQASTTLNFTIAPATLTVQATNTSVDFGQDIPTLAYTITGFQYDDSQSTIGGAPTETTTATKGSPVGQYPITITKGTLGTNSSVQNYSFVFQNGTLTITSLGAATPPVISPQSGTYTAPQTATITDSLTGATIYFTTDGSAPTTSSTVYIGPITVGRSETIQAAAIATGHDLSAITSAAFVLAPPALSTTSLDFGNITLGQASAAQTVTLTNQGKNALAGIAIALTGTNAGDFAIQSGSTCGSSLQAGASCAVAIVFSPAGTGSRSAILTFAYTGIGTPQSVTLQGTGVGPLSITTPPAQLVAGTTYQFTASGPASWTASAGTITSSGLFTAPNPPPDPATVTITATSLSNPQITATSQVTIVPAPAVTVPPGVTLGAGSTVSVPLTISAGTGIPGELLVLACTPATLPTGISCTFIPNPVVNAAGGTAVTLNLSSSAINAMATPEQQRPWNRLPLGGSVVLAACCLLFGSRRFRQGKMIALLLCICASAGLMYLTACGTGGSFKTNTQEGFATGTYEIKVTVTGASPGSPDYNQVVTIFSVKVDVQ